MIFILLILVLNSIQIETPSNFDLLKRFIIEDKRAFAIRHRFKKNVTLDTYFFSSLSPTHNVEIERITGMKKVSILILLSLLEKIKFLTVSNSISTLNLELINGEWAISSNKPTFEISLEYTSSVDSDFFGHLTVTSDSYLSLEKDNNEHIVCRLTIDELSLKSCGEHGGHIQEEIIQNSGRFDGVIKSLKCRSCTGDAVHVETLDIRRWGEKCTESNECPGQICENVARCDVLISCTDEPHTCPCGMECRSYGINSPKECYLIDSDCCLIDKESYKTSIHCPGDTKCYRRDYNKCVLDGPGPQ